MLSKSEVSIKLNWDSCFQNKSYHQDSDVRELSHGVLMKLTRTQKENSVLDQNTDAKHTYACVSLEDTYVFGTQNSPGTKQVLKWCFLKNEHWLFFFFEHWLYKDILVHKMQSMTI